MNSHRPPQELTSAPYHHYHQVIEKSYHPAPSPAYIYGVGPIVRVKPAPQPPERFVETLRQRGIKVRVQHYRWVIPRNTLSLSFELARVSKYERKRSGRAPLIGQNGGETHVSVQLPDGREAKGVAKCSTADPYNKRLGVWLAAKRALAALKKQDTPVATSGGGGGQEAYPANLN